MAFDSSVVDSCVVRAIGAGRRTGSEGKGLTPDKKLFEQYREEKEEEIERLNAVHEVRLSKANSVHRDVSCAFRWLRCAVTYLLLTRDPPIRPKSEKSRSDTRRRSRHSRRNTTVTWNLQLQLRYVRACVRARELAMDGVAWSVSVGMVVVRRAQGGARMGNKVPARLARLPRECACLRACVLRTF